jgi:hypothetical protein
MSEIKPESNESPATPGIATPIKRAPGRNPLEYLILLLVIAAGAWGAYVYVNSAKGFSWRAFFLLGEKKRQLVAATGEVYFNGKPMDAGTVDAYPIDPESGNKPAIGPIDPDGRFKLYTNIGGMTPGAGIGTYRLVLNISYPLQSGQLAPDRRLPEKYYKSESTPVTITVTADPAKNHFVIKEEGEEQPPPQTRGPGQRGPPEAEPPNTEKTTE